MLRIATAYLYRLPLIGCLISGNSPICSGSTNTYTASAGTDAATYAWSVTSGDDKIKDGANLDTSKAIVAGVGVGSTSIDVVAPAAAGTYTLSVTITKSGFLTQTCTKDVTVNAVPDKPVVIYHAPPCDSSVFYITVQGLVDGAVYTIVDKDGDPIPNITTSSNVTPVSGSSTDFTQATAGDFKVFGIAAGSGYQVSYKSNGCTSDAETCGASSGARHSAPTKPQSTNGKTDVTDLIAYPVPFSANVTVDFKATKAEEYVINLYNMQGQMIRELKAGNAKAGEVIKVNVSGSGLAESLYLVRKVSRSGVSTIKLLKAKEQY